MIVFVGLHLALLHFLGSKSRLLERDANLKVVFFPRFINKDLLFIVVFFRCYFLWFNFYFLGEAENFLSVDVVSSPLHIKPEWYFLFLYRMLRCISSKLLGVFLIFMGIFLIVFMGGFFFFL